MACPVCNHTMQNLGLPERRVWWCARCGTLKEESGEFSRVEMPLHLHHVLTAARIKTGRENVSQHVTVDAQFRVSQYDEEIPRIELVMQDPLGSRLV